MFTYYISVYVISHVTSLLVSSGQTKKKAVGTIPRCRKRRDFDAVYFMRCTTAVRESPVPPVIWALLVT